ncbi:MAG: histidine kinase [Opitutaceae bacterium]|nr:histidine kinase [Opitutaceae bacterium]
MNEVSCRVLLNARHMLEADGRDWRPILTSKRYSAEHLFDASRRIDWNDWAETCDRARVLLGGRDELRKVSVTWGAGPDMLPLRRAIRLCLSAYQYYSLFGRMISTRDFGGAVRSSVEKNADGSLTCGFHLAGDYQGSYACFESAEGILAGIPSLVGYPHARTEAIAVTPRGCLFRVYPPPFRTLRNQIRSLFEVPIRMRDTAQLIHEHESSLARRYAELEAIKDDLHGVLMGSSEGMIIVREGMLLFANPAFSKLVGAEATEDLVGRSTSDWANPDDIEELRTWATSGNETFQRRELKIRHCTDGERWVEVSPPRTIRWRSSEAVLWMLREVSATREIELAAAEASEREKERIAHDLHDGLGQEMAAVTLHLGALQQELARQDNPLQKDARRLLELTVGMSKRAREMAHGLAPKVVVEQGLQEALLWYTTRASELFRISISLESEVGSGWLRNALPTPCALAVYRVSQEAISNARKHGRAEKVVLRLSWSNGHVHLDCEDDGCGLPVNSEASRGMGIKIMRHRLHIHQGVLELKPRRDGAPGLWLRASVPCPDGPK